jgi:hypothetical protein
MALAGEGLSSESDVLTTVDRAGAGGDETAIVKSRIREDGTIEILSITRVPSRFAVARKYIRRMASGWTQ